MRDTILIVDDEADIVSTLADYFLYNDYNVMTAASGTEAIEKAERQPDVILLDINMPDVDGLEVCARIRDFVRCPITILDHAAGKIAENNLDFKIIYDKEDELGKLCVSFEKMRQALQESNEEMWRQIEERKRLNAAFAHDLRTPLTVLKGQIELLRQYAPKMTAEKVSDTSKMMHRHIVRLEEYVQTMGELQRLEDIEIIRHPVTMDALCRQFRETGEVVCNGKAFFCEVIGDEHVDLNIDTTIVMRVFENLLSNAVRFAKEKIKVLTKLQDGYLYLTVSDDGAGFAEKDLENATKPFYKTVRETDNEHFGMGLNICKILCEKHGGYIRLSNQDGAVITVAFRQ